MTTTTTTTRRYYAAEWTYGKGMTTSHRRNGREVYTPAWALVSFPTRAARDAWASEGTSFRTEQGYREAVSSHDPDVAAAIRHDVAVSIESWRGYPVIERWEDTEEYQRQTDPEGYARVQREIGAEMDRRNAESERAFDLSRAEQQRRYEAQLDRSSEER